MQDHGGFSRSWAERANGGGGGGARIGHMKAEAEEAIGGMKAEAEEARIGGMKTLAAEAMAAAEGKRRCREQQELLRRRASAPW